MKAGGGIRLEEAGLVLTETNERVDRPLRRRRFARTVLLPPPKGRLFGREEGDERWRRMGKGGRHSAGPG